MCVCARVPSPSKQANALFCFLLLLPLLLLLPQAIKILNMIPIYEKPIRVNMSSQDKKAMDVGANLFVGNLDPEVDEKLLYDTFSAFGVVNTTPKIMRDPETSLSKGFGFVSFQTFEASDAGKRSSSFVILPAPHRQRQQQPN